MNTMLNRRGQSAINRFIRMPQSRTAGQIIIPSVLIIPSLLLFVYLLFEITKLSREKIRHQFATDSAAFIEMTNYSDFFNRTAYVNGSFPHRIFKEAYDCPPNEHYQMTSGGGSICPYDMLYEAGCFPRYEGDDSEGAMDRMSKWPIKFDDARAGMNQNPPQFDTMLKFVTEDQGIKIYIFWDAVAGDKGLYRFYAQVYNLLGSVETSQKTVFERLTENFNFFRKSYYLNTGECQQNPGVCGDDGLAEFKANRVHPVLHFIDTLKFWAKVPRSGLPPYYLGVTDPPLDMPGPGLFQLATVPDAELAPLKTGFEVYQGWDAPSNYFGIDVNKLASKNCSGKISGTRPCVHARIASQCPAGNNNCVWPDPTPKYQTRLYP